MEIKKSFKNPESEFLLVSVKSKSSNSSSIYVVEKNSINDFILTHLTSDVVLLIDSVDTFVKSVG